jgi:capsular exopolysaccharide synthesis family protein
VPGEGKTSTSINLALSLAQSGFNVILIEADMRRPKTRKYLGLNSKTEGLSEILSGKNRGDLKAQIDSTTQRFGDDIEIAVISAGTTPPNPSELLDSETFGEVVRYCSDKYDFTIIDCPPSLPVADASIVSTRVDGVLVITEAGKTRKNQFIGVREAITAVGGQLLGVVLNKIPSTRAYDDYGYRYGYGYGYRRRYGYRGYSGYKAYKPYAASSEEKKQNKDEGQ